MPKNRRIMVLMLFPLLISRRVSEIQLCSVNRLRHRQGRGVLDIDDDGWWPMWLKPLLRESFFVQCKIHADSYKSECNKYCLDCMNGALCCLCLSHHKDHRAIQIRRTSYHDVIRVSEITKVLDIAGIQTYIINSARVMFLNKRPQQRPGKGIANTCEVYTFQFCSLGCKITGSSKNRVQATASDSEGSYRSGSGCQGQNKSIRIRSFTASMPPPTATNYRIAKRRKGTPHRFPMGGGLIIEY